MTDLIVEANGHAALPPSAMYRWAACPGSVRLSAGIVGASSDAAEEGSAAHWLAYQILLAHKELRQFPYEVGKHVLLRGKDGDFVMGDDSTPTPKGTKKWRITEEMRDGVMAYVEYVLGLISERGVKHWYLERKFPIAAPHCHGTVDCLLYEPLARVTVIDFKYGQGVSVDAQENMQLLAYAVGASKLDDMVDEFELCIVQPRDRDGSKDVVRTWTIPADQLASWESGVLRPAVNAALAPDALLKAGHHCRWCPATAQCPEVGNAALAVAALDFEGLVVHDAANVSPPAPELIPDEKLPQVLGAALLLRDWIAAVEEHAFRKAEAGLKIEGFKLVQKRANRKWENEETAGAALIQVLGEDVYERKLRTVAQMENLAKSKGKGKEVLDGLWITPDNGLTLVPVSDKRKAVESLDMAAIPGLDFLA